MISHIEGKLVEKYSTNVVLEAAGVGYDIHISLHTFSQIRDGEFLKLYTYMQVKEDAHTLYGFYDKTERDLFKLLISVSGIGANTARLILSSMSPSQVQEAIAREDAATIQSIKGIGLKTAQRTIIELKDKILKTYALGTSPSKNIQSPLKDEALLALEVLGFPRKQSEKIVDSVMLKTPDLPLEEVIKRVLKTL